MKSSLVCVIVESLGTSQIGFEYRSKDMILFYLFTNIVSCAVLFSNQNNCVFVSHYSLVYKLYFSVFSWGKTIFGFL